MEVVMLRGRAVGGANVMESENEAGDDCRSEEREGGREGGRR